MRPTHELFDKAYVYQRPAKARAVMSEMRVANDDEFFTGLPEFKVTGKKRRRGIDFVSDADKQKAKIKMLEQKAKMLDDLISKQYVKYNESKGQQHFVAQQKSQRVAPNGQAIVTSASGSSAMPGSADEEQKHSPQV